MYRLIAPVVDFANSTLGYEAYFEFNQTSAHGTSQSVDIALLHNQVPRVIIEAKRVDRRIAAEQISKYLVPGVRGLVTNGVHWVMCANGESKTVSVCSPTDRKVTIESLSEVIAFIRGEDLISPGWSIDQGYVDPIIKSNRPHKEIRARRVSNLVNAVENINAMRLAFADLPRASDLDNIFLETLLVKFEEHGQLPLHLRCEVRASRVVFFDNRTARRRMARIELGKVQPDILILTELVGLNHRFSKIALAVPHDKGQHMRRFRLSDASQAKKFGKVLADILSL